MDGMNMFPALDIAGSGMKAESRRLEIVASNIANAQTQKTPNGEPYRRKEVLFETTYAGIKDAKTGMTQVAISGIVEDQTEFPRVFRGVGTPGADEEGFVRMPNVDMVYEMVDMMSAMRAFQSNLKTIESFKTMAEAALEIGK